MIAPFLFAVLALPGMASAEFKVPVLDKPVVDQGGMLSENAVTQLTEFLQRLKNSGGSEIQVVTLPDLGGLSLEEAGIKIADRGDTGNAKADNGVILLLSKAERKVRIEVGQGNEGNLPDLTVSRIIREVIVPRLKSGDIDRGVVDGVLSIVHYTDPKFLDGEGATAPAPQRAKGKRMDWIFFLLFFLFILMPAIGGRGRRSGLGGALLGYGLGRGLGGGGWGGGSGGGGGSWGGGGGGFSGGGSSGSW